MADKGLVKRADFERVALETGWVIDKHPESTTFTMDGFRLIARWLKDFPASFTVYGESGGTVESRSFTNEKWFLGAHLMRWLEVAPVRRDAEELPVLVRRYADVLELLDPDRVYPARAVAATLRRFLEEAR